MFMPDDVPPSLNWRKARRSISNGACVEVAAVGVGVLVRDSVNPLGIKIAYAPEAWQGFVHSAKVGKYDPAQWA
jgi:Domain of unknown function (DUF397)